MSRGVNGGTKLNPSCRRFVVRAEIMAHSLHVSDQEPRPSERNRFKYRFSLRGLLLATFLVAICISYWLKHRTLVETQAALENLRNEVGELTIGDEDLLHAIAIPSFEGMTYRWRIHLPTDRKFSLKTAYGMIPESGLPDKEACKIDTRPLDAASVGEQFIFSVAVNQNHLGQWQLVRDDGTRNLAWRIPDDQAKWLQTTSGHNWRQAGDGETVSADENESFFLIRLRKSKKVPGGSTVDMQPTNGILVWIEVER